MGSEERLHALVVEVVCLMHGVRDGEPVALGELDAAVAELACELDGAGDGADAALLDDADDVLATARALCAGGEAPTRSSSVLAA